MKLHFEEALSARYKSGGSTKLVTKGVRGKSASQKLTEEGLVKFSARVAMQVTYCTILFSLFYPLYFSEGKLHANQHVLDYRWM